MFKKTLFFVLSWSALASCGHKDREVENIPPPSGAGLTDTGSYSGISDADLHAAMAVTNSLRDYYTIVRGSLNAAEQGRVQTTLQTIDGMDVSLVRIQHAKHGVADQGTPAGPGKPVAVSVKDLCAHFSQQFLTLKGFEKETGKSIDQATLTTLTDLSSGRGMCKS